MAKSEKAPDKKTPNFGGGPLPLRLMYVMLLLLLGAQVYFWQVMSPSETDWDTFKTDMLAANQVKKLEVINKEMVEVFIKSDFLQQGLHENINKTNLGPHYYFTIGSVDSFEAKMEAAKSEYNLATPIRVGYTNRSNWTAEILSWMIPLLLFGALWFYILRRASPFGQGKNPFDFSKSKAQLFDGEKKSKIKFDDVAGLDEAKIEIMEIVDFMKNPESYTRLGAKIPKGIMLVGPPGTGKTLLAKAVAGEAQVPFFSLSGSEFVEMFVGVGASRVRDLFHKAKEKAPSIIFIDEIDAIGRSRGRGVSFNSNDERESTLNQLLTEMDGFGGKEGVIVMAATNRPDILDKALLRPGRFDRHIYLELPTQSEREAIFKVHLKRIKLHKDLDITQLAHQTPGFSGADIANICNEAALIAARKKKDAVYQEDFFEALDRVIGGLERKGKIISPEEKEIIAYHEAGHATVSWFLEHADQLIKVTIVPRGKSLGAAWYAPEEHQIYTRPQLTERLCAALGGRAAEALIFGEVSSGAVDDLEKVTKQAYAMVAYYGLNDKLGNISFYDSSGQQENAFKKPYSEATAQLIDEEVRNLIAEAFEKTTQILKLHKKELTQLAQLLLKKELVLQEDLHKIFGDRPGIKKTDKVPV